MRRLGVDLQSTIFFFFSFTYSFVLVSLPIDSFKDRSNYLAYAEKSSLVLIRYFNDGVLATLTNEPFWLLINSVLGIFFEPEASVSLIIGFSAFIVAFSTLRSDPRNALFILLCLLLPQVLNNYIVHLRQGLAISVFMVGWLSGNRLFKYLCLFLSPLIHSSFFFILALIFICRLGQKLKLASDVKSLLFLSFGLIISFSLALIAENLGTRQAEQYDLSSTNVSGLGFALWSMVLVLFLAQGNRFVQENNLSFGVLIFYLSTYFFVSVSGRILESVILVILLTGLKLTGWRRKSFLGLAFVYGFIDVFTRLSKPMLGFAPS